MSADERRDLNGITFDGEDCKIAASSIMQELRVANLTQATSEEDRDTNNPVYYSQIVERQPEASGSSQQLPKLQVMLSLPQTGIHKFPNTTWRYSLKNDGSVDFDNFSTVKWSADESHQA